MFFLTACCHLAEGIIASFEPLFSSGAHMPRNAARDFFALGAVSASAAKFASAPII
jgi:hypothetical protein